METLKKLTPYAIIAALVAIILFQGGCFGKKTNRDVLSINGKKYETIKHEIDTSYKTKPQIFYRKGKNIIHEVEVIKEIPANVDTASILKDYYAKVFYNDTFKLKDTLGYIIINDTISKNRILGRKLNSSINVPTIKETLYLKELNNNFFVGPSFQLGSVPSIGGDIHLKTKKDMLFGVGAGLNLNATPYIRGSVSWKIK
jgi:hypothetical protein